MPSTATTLSPGLSTFAAGLFGVTFSTTGWVNVSVVNAYSAHKMTNASTMLTSGPAKMTTIRFQTFWRKYARSATSGAITSSGLMPGDLHVAPERDRPDRVLGLGVLRAPPPDQRREEQREALDAHADGLGGDEMAELMQDDQRGEAREREEITHAISVAGRIAAGARDDCMQ